MSPRRRLSWDGHYDTGHNILQLSVDQPPHTGRNVFRIGSFPSPAGQGAVNVTPYPDIADELNLPEKSVLFKDPHDARGRQVSWVSRRGLPPQL